MVNNLLDQSNNTASKRRTIKVADNWVTKLNLNLSSLCILTEAATGAYAAIPAVLLKAGASHVYAWARDSEYGSADRALSEVKEYLSLTGQSESHVTFAVNNRPLEQVPKVDIIMNSGLVRPLDKELLVRAKEGNSTIALLYDAWEIRDGDIDIDLCKKLGVKIAGVNENDASLGIFDLCGQLGVKMALNAGYEVVSNRVLVWSEDQFGDVIAAALNRFGAAEVIQTTDKAVVSECMEVLDFIFLCEYGSQKKFTGEKGIIEDLAGNSSERFPGIIHLYGEMDYTWCCERGLNVFPKKDGRANKMSETLDYLGPYACMGLLVAGIRAAVAHHSGEECRFLQTVV